MINLIPPQLKKERDLKLILNEVAFGLLALFSLLVILTLAFAAFNFDLSRDQKNLDKKIAAANERLPEFEVVEKMVNEINSKLSRIDTVAQDRTTWSEVSKQIAMSTPPTVQIKNLGLTNVGTISMTGQAASRRDIALMKEKLEQTNSFKNVIFSSSSYNQSSNDFSFSISFELNKEKK